MSSPAHSLLTLSKGPLFLHLYYVIIIIFCLKFKSSCSLSRTLNLFLEVSGILYFLRLFLKPPSFAPIPITNFDKSSWQISLSGSQLKNLPTHFLSFFFFFFPFQYSWCQNVMICFAPVTEFLFSFISTPCWFPNLVLSHLVQVF